MQTLKVVLGSFILGILISLSTGFLLNESGISIPEIKRYGQPLIWLITDLNGPTEYLLTNLITDIVFWVLISFIALFIINRILDYSRHCGKIDMVLQDNNLKVHLEFFRPKYGDSVETLFLLDDR